MLSLVPSDFRPIDSFELTWRWIVDGYVLLDENQLSRIEPIRKPSAQLIHTPIAALKTTKANFINTRISEVLHMEHASLVGRCHIVITDNRDLNRKYETFSRYLDK